MLTDRTNFVRAAVYCYLTAVLCFLPGCTRGGGSLLDRKPLPHLDHGSDEPEDNNGGHHSGDVDHHPNSDLISDNVDLLAHLALEDFGASFGAEVHKAMDVVGYVSESGREYALIGLIVGTGIVEVTNPLVPKIVAVVPGPDGDVRDDDVRHDSRAGYRDAKVYGHYAYTVTENNGGVQVLDLAEIDSGVVKPLGSFGPPVSAHNLLINADSGFLYALGTCEEGRPSLSCSNPNNMIVAIYALKQNPEAPTYVSQITGRDSRDYVHDAIVWTETTGPYAGREILITFGGDESRDAAGHPVGVDILDVTDKQNPVYLSSFAYPGLSYAHSGALSEDKRYLLISDEMDEQQRSVPTRTYIYDIAELEQPHYVGIFGSGLSSIDHNMQVLGDHVFQANYGSGLRIFDISDIHNVRQTGYYDTYLDEERVNYDGAFGVEATLPSGIVVVSDDHGGLFVLDASAAVAPGAAANTVAITAPTDRTFRGRDEMPIYGTVAGEGLKDRAWRLEYRTDELGAVWRLIASGKAAAFYDRHLADLDITSLPADAQVTLRLLAASAEGSEFVSTMHVRDVSPNLLEMWRASSYGVREYISLPTVPIGATARRVIEVHNRGAEDALIRGIVVPEPFYLANDETDSACAVGQALSPGASCDLVVSYRPTDHNAREATISVAFDDAIKQRMIFQKVRMVADHVLINGGAATVEFSRAPGDPKIERLTVTNVGDIATDIVSPREDFIGRSRVKDPFSYDWTGPNTCRSAIGTGEIRLGPGQSCTIDLRVVTFEEGIYSERLIVRYRGYDAAIPEAEITIRATVGTPLPGDLNGDDTLDASDIDAMFVEIRTFLSQDARFDLTGDRRVDFDDALLLIQGADYFGTSIGDANLDGQFDSSDFIAVFKAGQYEDGVHKNSTWATGDWNGDGEFDSSDLVLALQQGKYTAD